MEYCEGGDLRKILDEYEEIPMADKVTIISQILLAIKRIHEAGFIHGDLKCSNIFLVNKYKPGNKNIKIKIGDFGLSEIGGDLVYGGTPGFMAPEVPSVGGSFEADIYSIAKVMLEIMTQLPVEFIASINISNLSKIQYKLPKFLNITQFYDVIKPCLLIDFTKRPNAEELCDHFHGLMAYWLLCEKINFQILEKYKVGDIVPVDSHNHPLTLSDGQMRQYPEGSIWICDICKNHDHPFLGNTYSFHCHSCKYDLCLNCLEKHNGNKINNMMLEQVNGNKKKKMYVLSHNHHLFLSNKEDKKFGDGSWICDICKVGFTGYIYSFRCQACDYDVCLKCYINNKKIKEDNSCCIIY